VEPRENKKHEDEKKYITKSLAIEARRLLGCYVVSLGKQLPTFRRTVTKRHGVTSQKLSFSATHL
jgi:hypothetical protein